MNDWNEGDGRCRICGVTLPTRGALAGLCPHCLLLGTLDSDGDHESARTLVTSPGRFPTGGVEGNDVPNIPAMDHAAALMDDDEETAIRPSRASLQVLSGGIPSHVGAWRVLRSVEGGGMGIVYLAEHSTIGRQAAIKVLRAEFAANREVVFRFFAEARLAANIGNEHIVDVFDFNYLPDGRPYIVMEWLVGRSLAKLLRDEGPLPEARAAQIAAGIADGIAAAHARGVVHRDLKPDNVFLIQRGGNPDFVKVLDFGIAKLLQDEPGWTKTKTGSVFGTPPYMSPEQCAGHQQGMIDHRTDVYALGVIVYEMLTGTVPFMGNGWFDILAKHIYEAPEPPSRRKAGLAPWVDEVLLRALAKSPADRHQSVVDLAVDLGRPSVKPDIVAPSGPSRTSREAAPTAVMGMVAPRRKPRTRLIVAGAALVLLPVGVWLASRAPRASAVVPNREARIFDMSRPDEPLVLAGREPSPTPPRDGAAPPSLADGAPEPPSRVPPTTTRDQSNRRRHGEKSPVPAHSPVALPAPPPIHEAPPPPPEPALPPSIAVRITSISSDAEFEVRVNGRVACRKTPCTVPFTDPGPFRIEFVGDGLFESKSLGPFMSVAEVKRHASDFANVKLKMK